MSVGAEGWALVALIVITTIAFCLFVAGYIMPARIRQYPKGRRTFTKDYEPDKQAVAAAQSNGHQAAGTMQTVAVGTDGSPTAAIAVEAAVDLAERHGARLLVISSYKPVDEDTLSQQHAGAPAELQWALNPSQQVDSILEAAAAGARSRGIDVSTVAAQGDPADVLCGFAADQDADVLVIGNKGMERRVLGSVPNSVAHKAPCSVMIVKTYEHDTRAPAQANGRGTAKTVAVGTDGTPTASVAVEAAADLADRHGARLLLISSYKPVDEDTLSQQHAGAPAELQWALNPSQQVDAILEAAANGARSRGLEVSTVAAPGNPADVLCQSAAEHDADVLVIGNKGMERRILGSVPNSVAHKAPCSVMIVKTT